MSSVESSPNTQYQEPPMCSPCAYLSSSTICRAHMPWTTIHLFGALNDPAWKTPPSHLPGSPAILSLPQGKDPPLPLLPPCGYPSSFSPTIPAPSFVLRNTRDTSLPFFLPHLLHFSSPQDPFSTPRGALGIPLSSWPSLVPEGPSG